MKFNWFKVRADIIPLFAFFMIALLPTSFRGQMNELPFLIVVWMLSGLFIVCVILQNAINITAFKAALFIVLYMVVVTTAQLFANVYARVSLARIVPLAFLLLMLSIDVKYYSNLSMIKKIIDLFSVLTLFWNAGILLQINPVIEFTKDFYSQYQEKALYYSLLYRKPVLTFGVHNYASFFYFLFFYFCYCLASKTKQKRYYLFCLMYIVYTFLLTSNSSIIYAILMLCMFVYLIRKKIYLIIGVAVTALIIFWSNFQLLYVNYSIFLADKKSGFRGRYFSDNNIYIENFKLIKSSFGIGFCILDNVDLNYRDSGYIVYATMGNIILVIALYGLLLFWIKRNISKRHRFVLAFIVLSFELASVASFQYRYIYMLVFVMYFFSALDKSISKNIELDCS